MGRLTMTLADDLYRALSEFRLKRYRVGHPALHVFCRDLGQFERTLGPAADDEYWAPWLHRLRAFRFRALATPLPCSHPAVYIPEEYEALKSHFADCDRVYPVLAPLAAAVLSRLGALAQSDEAPLLDLLAELRGDNDQRNGLVLAATKLILDAEEALTTRGIQNVEVLNPRQVRRSGCFDRMFALGSPRWFPEHLFTVPRAPELCFLHYGWIQARITPEPVFSGSPVRLAAEEVFEVPGSRTGYLGEELVMELPIQGGGLAVEALAGDTSEDDTEACLFRLESDQGVFLPTGTKTLVIDLDEGPGAFVQRKLVEDIEPGMFILLRTDVVGDYIIPIADVLMADLAPRARAAQREWKRRLQEQVADRGLAQLREELKRRGCDRATGLNIRNWMSRSSIRPHFFQDFQSILLNVGLGDQADEYWYLMGKIDRAHTKAGQQVRRQLIRRVKDEDLRDLDRYGQKDFTLEGTNGVRITAFRVEQVLQRNRRIGASRLAQLI